MQWIERCHGTTGEPRPGRRRLVAAATVPLAAVLFLAGCGSSPKVSYPATAKDPNALTVYVGPGDYRKILQYAADNLLPSTVKLKLVDATGDANAQVVADHGDLAFYQHIPAFEGDQQQHRWSTLSIASKVDVEPYALYSSKWQNLKDTKSWENTGLVADKIIGKSLPHGARIALPDTPTGFARGLYLLQSAGLVKLNVKPGGTTPTALTISQANVVDSPRHLSLVNLTFDDLKSIYREYDAVVLSPAQAATLGLVPDKDALAIEPGPGNPYTHVLVAPSRLAGDPRVLDLTHALEGPQLAQFLTTKYQGADISATVDPTKKAGT